METEKAEKVQQVNFLPLTVNVTTGGVTKSKTTSSLESYYLTQFRTITGSSRYPVSPKNRAPKILDKLIQERIFDDNPENFDIWMETSSKAQRLVWEGKATTHKLSALAEEFYEKLADAIGGPVLYRKGKLYDLIKLVEPESIPKEITEKLNLIQKLLVNSSPQE